MIRIQEQSKDECGWVVKGVAKKKIRARAQIL